MVTEVPPGKAPSVLHTHFKDRILAWLSLSSHFRVFCSSCLSSSFWNRGNNNLGEW